MSPPVNRSRKQIKFRQQQDIPAMNKTSAYISEVPSTNIHAVIRQQFISPHSNKDLVSLAAVFWMSRNAPPKETAADIRTTFLSHCPCGLSDWTSLKR